MMEDKLLKLLVDENIITSEQYQHVLQECERSRVSSDVALEHLDILDENQLLEFLSGKFRMPIVNWETFTVDQELLTLVPEHVATKYTVFPLLLERGKRQGKITLAVANPSNVSAIDDISFMTGCIVRAEISSTRAIDRAIQSYYKGQEEPLTVQVQQETLLAREEFVPCGIAEFDSLLADLAKSPELAEEEAADALSGLDREHPSTKFLYDILDIAVKRGFSEIHIDLYGQEQRVRFGLHGFLHQHTLIPDNVGRGIASRLRRIAHPLEDSSTKKNDDFGIGSFYTTHFQGKPLTVIVNFYSTPFGEKVFLKLKESSSLPDIGSLGIDEKSLKMLSRILAKPQGLLLLISPPKHGKTTTLYAILRKFCQTEGHVVSLEYPVESLIPGIRQIPFNPLMPYQDWFALLSYSVPDLLVIEKLEIPLLTQLAVELASSTLILGSLAAPDFAEGLCAFLATLLSLFKKSTQEIFPFILETINGIISQRLVRTVCPHCKEEISLSDQDVEMLRWLSATDEDVNKITVYSGKGCHECMETGYQGQTGLFEMIKLDKGLKQYLLQSQSLCAFQIRQIFTEMAEDTIKHQAFHKIRAGLTSLEEIRRVVVRQAQEAGSL